MTCSCINPRCADLRELADETFVVLEFDRAVAAADGCRNRRTFEDAIAAYRRKDYATALSLFRSLAEQGDPHAQYNLAVRYERGGGVAQNYAEAAKWYGLAAKRGDAGAGSVLERIRSVQAGQSAQSQRLEARGAGLPSMGRLEPAMFRFSSPTIEQRTVRIGPPPSAGFHMMTAHHFGRR
jgi:hypothetical protein